MSEIPTKVRVVVRLGIYPSKRSFRIYGRCLKGMTFQAEEELGIVEIHIWENKNTWKLLDSHSRLTQRIEQLFRERLGLRPNVCITKVMDSYDEKPAPI